MTGARSWFIPDAYLPSTGIGDRWESHESVCVLNRNAGDAVISMTLFFEDSDPIRDVIVIVPGQRCKHIRLDRPEQLGGVVVPRDVPYAIELISDVPLIVQYSRLDVTQPNFTLMTTIPFYN